MSLVSGRPIDTHATILDSINDGVFTVDEDWHITSFNKAAERITGVKRQQAIGKPCCEVFRASICETACALRQTLKTSRPVVSRLHSKRQGRAASCQHLDGRIQR